jgi:formate hydrogenlyase subunit 3/multisubunit Na+/H+ antiporter MnhD subunit
LALFALVSAAIALSGAFYSHSEDAPALRSLPRRLFVFFLSCTILGAVLLVMEHTFASVR